MSRKAPSFAQLIDYIEAEAKTGTRANHRFSVFHNTYSRDSEHLKAEFVSNAENLSFRKNGVYLYHEVISITRSQRTHEDHQKEALQQIVKEYLSMRASKQLAYAVLHEDKADNLHFHLVISANEAGNSQRKRLSKSDFSSIQTQLEKWTLEAFPELEQQAVFAPNQTKEQKQARAKKAHISNQGAELKRRGGKTTERDTMKETLEAIFSTSTSGQHFAELLQKAGLKFYTRGKNHGVSTEDGTKYRFSTLGLAEAWEALDHRMSEILNGKQNTQQDTEQNNKTAKDNSTKPKQEAKNEGKQPREDTEQNRQDRGQNNTKDSDGKHQDNTKTTTESHTTAPDPIEEEAERRLEEMKHRRQKKADRQTQATTSHKQKP